MPLTHQVSQLLQAEEERKAAEEAAALEAAEEVPSDPVGHVRAFIGSHEAVESAAELEGLEVEGGLAGRMRVLYEVCLGWLCLMGS